MTYSEPLVSQLNYFLLSLGFGFFIDLWYVIVMLIRMCISEKKCAVIIGDIFFSVTASIASFFFMVHYNNGQVRLNVIMGQVISAIVLHVILGSKILSILIKPASLVRRTVAFIMIPIKTYFFIIPMGVEKIKKHRREKMKKNNKLNNKKAKKFNIIAKIHLKNKNKSV